MVDFPTPVIEYVLTLIIENRSLAYFLVNKDGCLLTWGGKLAEYGVTNLRKGENALNQICFLEGLLPLDDFPLFLPCLQTELGRCADVHIFSTEEGDWVLLLDATLNKMQTSIIQQQANELSLLQEKGLRGWELEIN
ncbi:hypothetical protein G7B40_023905 [Aetokthonos hydrillicola Thurmond2011]|jgi:hypothetical protein|uniref:Uncharacterized protein n=1 Tax=Aetokthonos hydrillicola Thurmond2011 TaxID=2712845 RepID=A0AAP5MBV8_9CYAN|nr:hypothetical protein [Aetokthonos hydrillicola]MBO3460204.1 hypothetical protein [Aetokthonos hydrillicola CCALA 1050]MBW4586937.1 hypothetical protein [Aetokthonos hydrillicola CCALA 1050]MDR9897588.1 hypothetical protein [Aetokthonos hydrillicola Thurmond2011]